MNKPALIYFGSSYFSAIFLEKLLSDSDLKQIIKIKCVITQPDKPVGRKQILTPTKVKLMAQKYNIPVCYYSLRFQKSNLKIISKNLNQNKKTLDLRCGFDIYDLGANVDLCLVFAFGEIIPKKLLALPKYGFINIHPSLLPKYRGPSPIAYPLINGDTVTGVTLIQMDEKIDHGPIISQEKLDILPGDRRPDLEIKLTDLAFLLFKKTITQLRIADCGLKTRSQNHKEATYTKLLKKSDGFISFSVLKKVLNNQPISPKELPPIIKNLKLEIRNLPKIIFDYFRGLYPWPGLWTTIRVNPLSIRENLINKRLKITDLQYKDEKLIIRRVQLEGKKEVDFETFNRAYKVF
ncbi:MAG: methionyl-tRNA formyltransferase [Microgenomates group bacterium]|nr:methionyl-tRNA formyltransferase [Microgenomates group bacterium]